MPISRSSKPVPLKGQGAASRKPVIGITMGDPAGIGPEIIAKALAKQKVRGAARYVIIGSMQACDERRIRSIGDVAIVDPSPALNGRIRAGRPGTASARASLAYLTTAVDLLKTGKMDGLVTCPVSKEGISSLGQPFHGHTELLARAFGVRHYEMMFVAPAMRTVLVTRHIALDRVSRAITAAKVLDTLKVTDQALKQDFGIRRPRIAVCGINPHAGEGGLIGPDEKTKVIPALQKARRLRIRAEGPFAADTLFSPDIGKTFDCIVAMYHDQGLIPVKTLFFNRLVNLTVGLPFIRTSPAHGTAFDIAGRNKADPSSMIQSVRLATALTARRRTRRVSFRL